MPRFGVQCLRSRRMSFKLTSISFSFFFFLVFLNFTEGDQVSLERCGNPTRAQNYVWLGKGFQLLLSHLPCCCIQGVCVLGQVLFLLPMGMKRSLSSWLYSPASLPKPIFNKVEGAKYLWLEHYGYQGHKFSFLQPPWKVQPGLFSYPLIYEGSPDGPFRSNSFILWPGSLSHFPSASEVSVYYQSHVACASQTRLHQ